MVTQIREMAEMMQRGWIPEIDEEGKVTGFGKESDAWSRKGSCCLPCAT